eukprot:gene2371-4603_t
MLSYPNGATALVITEAPNGQNRYFVFDNDKKGTCLLSIDEYAVGFCTCKIKKSSEVVGVRVVLSKVGAIVTDEVGDIRYEWKWDRGALYSGTPPTSYIIIKLNDYFELKLQDRYDMILEYRYENTVKVYDVSLKHMRKDSYLDKCEKGPGGRLLPKINYTSLKNRQIDFNEKMRAQRNKLHPKSENLTDMVRDVVTDLESNFETISDRMQTSIHFGHSWKSDALATTLNEIPRVPLSGSEVGLPTGFGTTIYTEEKQFSNTCPPILMNRTGGWKDEMEIRTSLREVNPPLQRSSVLATASGRYSNMLVVNRSRVSANNPQGCVEVPGLSLESMGWNEVKDDLSLASSNPTNSAIFVILLYRSGDPKGLYCDHVAQIVNQRLQDEKTTASSRTATSVTPLTANNATASARITSNNNTSNINNKFRMIKVDVSENNNAVKELGIKNLPTFVMKQGNTLMYAGLIGGKKLKSNFSTAPKVQVLLVEPIFQHQIDTEKALRKAGCEVFLCLTAAEAMERVQSLSSTEYGLPYSLVLISDAIQTADVANLGQRLATYVKSGQVIVCALATVREDSGSDAAVAVAWDHHCTDDVSLVVAAPLSTVATVAMRKPVRFISVERLLVRLKKPTGLVISGGLTPDTLYDKMLSVHAEATGKPIGQRTVVSNSYVGIRLASEDGQFRGRKLIGSTSCPGF